MPAHRKPSNVLALNGATKRNPGRHADRANEPAPTKAIGEAPPVTLSEVEALCWQEIVAKCAPGVLADADEALVELTAKLLAAVRYGEALELTKNAPMLVKCLGLLGMSPADRSRVQAAGTRRAPSPFDEFVE